MIALTGRAVLGSLPAQRYLLPGVRQIGLDLDRPSSTPGSPAVEAMWAAGFVGGRALAERGLREGLTASRALGYPQVLRFLDGELTEDQARDETITGDSEVRPAAGLLVSQGADRVVRCASHRAGRSLYCERLARQSSADVTGDPFPAHHDQPRGSSGAFVVRRPVDRRATECVWKTDRHA